MSLHNKLVTLILKLPGDLLMPLRLNKQKFARNKAREKEVGNIFNKTYTSLINFMPFIITFFFAPVLFTTSLFSKELFLMCANICLALSYLSSFAYRLYRKEMSTSELIISTLILTALVALSIYFYPIMMLQGSYITILGFFNQMATAVNLFFVVKHAIVPPLMVAMDYIAHCLTINVASRYYTKAPLTIEEDRYVLDKLLRDLYQHDSFDEQFDIKKISHFNTLLNTLCFYINKYDASFLGYLVKKEAITAIESNINQLTIEAAPEAAYAFIRKKIDFKTTKVKLLHLSKKQLDDELTKKIPDSTSFLDYFENTNEQKAKTDAVRFLHNGSICLHNEITRQEEKISLLQKCVPVQ